MLSELTFFIFIYESSSYNMDVNVKINCVFINTAKMGFWYVINKM